VRNEELQRQAATNKEASTCYIYTGNWKIQVRPLSVTIISNLGGSRGVVRDPGAGVVTDFVQLCTDLGENGVKVR
jgi:hypothetical protein